jgi:TrmH family RNA methyltransferase
MEQLADVRIVLLNTYHPGNIGAAARAMKTMGLSDLVLVEPESFPHQEAKSRAAGASDILDNASVVSSLAEAISDRTQVFATTARQKHQFTRPHNDCAQVAQWVSNHANEKIAIVFGCERSGMRAQDIELCHQILTIPGNPEYDILNMAAAVQIVSYELFKASNELNTSNESDSVESSDQPRGSLAKQKDIDNFYQHLQQSLEQKGYIREEQPTDTMKKLRQFFSKASPTANEVSMMRGIIVALTRKN